MRKHQGMTLISMLLTMVVIVCTGILVIRVVPVYIEQYEIIGSINALNTLPASEFSGDPSADASVLRYKLLNQLYINSIESISPEQININPVNPGHYRISIKYQEIKPLIGNVSLLFNFEVAREVKASAI